MVGQSISHYRIVDQLGQGGMGVVYRAQDVRLHRDVALKFFPAELAGDPEAVKRFEREAKAASALDHPNICTVYEVDEADDGRTFIAMACYEGTTLKQRIAGGPMPLEEIRRIGAQIAAGLAEAHRKGIVHRDLKPANIIITADGVVKIVDFGLALLSGESRITKANATAGTPSYMAPEQVRGDEADQRADLWALGTLLYEMATGRPAFDGKYVEAVMYQIVHGEPGELASLDAGLHAVIERCLRKDPSERFQSADEIRTALVDPDVDQPRYKRWLPKLAGAVAAVATLGAILLASGLLRLPSTSLFGGLFEDSELTELHVAVLPLRVIGATAQSDAYARGLAEVITSNLTKLDPYAEASFWVVPTSEILRREVASPDEARRLFGANLVLDGSVQQSGERVRLTLNLTDTQRLRQIATWTGDFSHETAVSVQDHAALQAAQMLQLHVPNSAREEISLGGTKSLGGNEYYIQGRGYLQRFDERSNIETAISLFHKALAEDPDFVLAIASLAEAHWRMYDATKDVAYADSALTYGRRVENRQDLPAQVFVSLGLVYDGTGRHQLALDTFEKALRRDPTNVDAYLGRAEALDGLDRTAEAEKAYLQVIQLRPDYWAGYHELGVFYFNEGRFEDSEEQFQKEIGLTPDNAHAHSNLGGLYYYMEQWDKAEEHLRRAIELRPMYRAYSNLGTLHFHREQFEDAISMFRQALKFDSTDYSVWGYLGTAYKLTDEPKSSNDAFRRALDLARARRDVVPSDVAAQASMAFYTAVLGRPNEALSVLDNITAHERTDERVAYQLAQAYEVLGRREEALYWINTAVENGLSPFFPTHNTWLADLRTDPRFALSDATEKR